MRLHKIFGPNMNRSRIKVGSRPFDHKARQEQINVVGVGVGRRKKSQDADFPKGVEPNFQPSRRLS